jgi:hypothetical protein
LRAQKCTLPNKMQKLAVLLLLVATLAILFGDAAAAVRLQLTHTDSGRGLTPRDPCCALHKERFPVAFRTPSTWCTSPSAHLLCPVQHAWLRQRPRLDSGPSPGRASPASSRPCPDSTRSSPPPYVRLRLCGVSGPAADVVMRRELMLIDQQTKPSPLRVRLRLQWRIVYDNHTLNSDTFEFAGGAAMPAMAFGCGRNNTGIFKSNETGITWFGRGSALFSAVSASVVSFTAIRRSTPPTPSCSASLYSSSALGAVHRLQTTPLTRSPAIPTCYLSLKGNRASRSGRPCRLPIPESTFTFTTKGSGWTIVIDSGGGQNHVSPRRLQSRARCGRASVAQVSLPVSRTCRSWCCTLKERRWTWPDTGELRSTCLSSRTRVPAWPALRYSLGVTRP